MLDRPKYRGKPALNHTQLKTKVKNDLSAWWSMPRQLECLWLSLSWPAKAWTSVDLKFVVFQLLLIKSDSPYKKEKKETLCELNYTKLVKKFH